MYCGVVGAGLLRKSVRLDQEQHSLDVDRSGRRRRYRSKLANHYRRYINILIKSFK